MLSALRHIFIYLKSSLCSGYNYIATMGRLIEKIACFAKSVWELVVANKDFSFILLFLLYL